MITWLEKVSDIKSAEAREYQICRGKGISNLPRQGHIKSAEARAYQICRGKGISNLQRQGHFKSPEARSFVPVYCNTHMLITMVLKDMANNLSSAYTNKCM